MAVLHFSSLLLTIFFGAALGNVIRGVPLEKDGYFFLPLWTNWRVGPEPGVLDWYTVTAGLVALVALTTHGAHWVALKTSRKLNLRARMIASTLWPALVLLTLISLWASLSIRPELLGNYRRYPALFAIPLVVATSLAAMALYRKRANDKAAFLSSVVYLVFMLVGAGLRSTPTCSYPPPIRLSTSPSITLRRAPTRFPSG